MLPDTSEFFGSEKDPRVALIHPPAISKRYLKTKFMPYGMSVIYAFLKEHSVPVIQYDFLMEYLFNSPEDVNFHSPERSFSEDEFFSFLTGSGSHTNSLSTKEIAEGIALCKQISSVPPSEGSISGLRFGLPVGEAKSQGAYKIFGEDCGEDLFTKRSSPQSSLRGLADFVDKYGSRITPDAGMHAFSIVAYHQFWAALLLAGHIREINPRAVIVFGGPFITIKPAESFVRFGIADYWVKGSGELPLLMLHALLMGRCSVTKEQIPGLIYVEGGEIHQSEQSEFPAEAERAPDFEGLNLDDYRYDHPLTGEKTFFLPYRLSKGCPSRCSFCTGRLVDRYDYKSVEKVLRELTLLTTRYGTNNFQFADASINGNPRQLSEICRRLSSELPHIRWYSYGKVNGFSGDLLKNVKDAGCFALFWGVESGHQPTVKLLGKHFDVGEMYKLLDDAVAVGIKNYVHLIYNTPHESHETLDCFIQLVERYIDSDMVVFLPQRFLLEPQSLMFDHPDRYGLSNVRRVQAPIFEREQYIFDEIQGPHHFGITERNDHHLRMLAQHLELIRYRNLLNGAGKSNLMRLIPRLLLRSWKFSRRFPMFTRIHDRLVRRIELRAAEIREQL
jgi:radical SAM superfamily enzyme YgiQ (UPF0313 family)